MRRRTRRGRGRTLWRSVLMGLAATAPLACANSEPAPADAPAPIEGPSTWGGIDNVTRAGRLWFSGQPDEAALHEARAAGVGVVINLRDPSEHEWDERAVAERAGLVYYNVPISGAEKVSARSADAIQMILLQHPDQPVWLHCSSSNRVGGWYAVHLARQGVDVDAALAAGRQAGMTKPEVEERARAVIGGAE